jgi:arginase
MGSSGSWRAASYSGSIGVASLRLHFVTSVSFTLVTEFTVIGAPTSAGAHAPGQELAPAALRAAGLPVGLGDTTHRRWTPDRVNRRAQNAAAVVEAAREVEARVRAAIDDGRGALVLGGDCTIELGVVAAAAPAGLVYFDMHPDLNTPDTIPGGTLDWMGVAHLLGLPGTHPDVAAVARLAPRDIVFLAADPTQTTAGEQDAIAAHGLRTISMQDTIEDPPAAVRRALDLLPHDRLLVHFDVDTVDFVDLPLSENTGHNIGMPFATARVVLEALLADPRVAALTVTQHNPLHGPEDGSATQALADVLGRMARLPP